MKPTAGKNLRGLFWLIPVTLQQRWRAMHDLPSLANRHIVHRLIDDTRVGIEHRAPGAGWSLAVFVRKQYRSDRTNFGLAINIVEPGMRQTLAQLGDRRRRHDRGAI